MPPLPVVTFVLGGWDLGTHADLILQGILFAQFTNYWSRDYKSDSLFLKLFVLGLCISTTFKSAHAIAFVWFQNVEYFADIGKAANMFFTNWVTQSTTLIGGIIAFSVQAFFCRRLWIISNNICVVAFVVLLFVFGLISGIVYTAFIFSGQLFRVLASQTVGHYHEPTNKVVWGPIHYGTVAMGDVILSGTTIYFLLKRSQEAEAETVGILNRLTRVVFQSAVPVTVCAFANFICGALYTQHPSTGATVLFVELTNMMLPKLYAISAMWTLNARKEPSSRFGADGTRNSRQIATTIQFRRHSVNGFNSRKEMSSQFGADVSSNPEPFSSRQMATTIKIGRHSVEEGSTARIESQGETHEMVDIPVQMFQRRIMPYPDDIKPTQIDA
ncbi:hypothetical protein C8J57DRAFT_194065 [Mycena rebaudengoi]|nr:hypothetical protein C8J57DRAFT_194065 [Mycena rebaudengoi]